MGYILIFERGGTTRKIYNSLRCFRNKFDVFKMDLKATLDLCFMIISFYNIFLLNYGGKSKFREKNRFSTYPPLSLGPVGSDEPKFWQKCS